MRYPFYFICHVTLLLSAPIATANMASPDLPGDVFLDPFAPLDSIIIENEVLSIDMRAVSESGSAGINATYHVRNLGTSREIDLVFVTGGIHESARGVRVSLDGEPIPLVRESSITLPTSWSLPDSIPSPTTGEYQNYWVATEWRGKLPSISFSLVIPPGSHSVEVVYRALPSTHSLEPPVQTWQLGYVLSPAREWSSFGELSVEVLIPAGWEWSAEPELKMQEGTLVGKWQNLPADHLGIAIRPVPPGTALIWTANNLPHLLAGTLLLLFSWFTARLVGRWVRPRQGWVKLLVPFPLLFALLAVTVLGIFEADRLADRWIDEIFRGTEIPGFRYLYVLIPAGLFGIGTLLLAGVSYIRAVRSNTKT